MKVPAKHLSRHAVRSSTRFSSSSVHSRSHVSAIYLSMSSYLSCTVAGRGPACNFHSSDRLTHIRNMHTIRTSRYLTSRLCFFYFFIFFQYPLFFFFPPLIDWPIANESFLHRWLITYFHYPWNAIQHALFSAKVKVLYFTRWAKGSFTHASRKTPIFTSCEVQFRTMLVRTIWFRLFCLEHSSKNVSSH